MAVSAIDSVRNVPQSAMAASAPAKPSHSFDQLLAAHRTKSEPTKPDPKPHVEAKRADAPKKNEKAKVDPNADGEAADDASRTDAATPVDDADSSEKSKSADDAESAKSTDGEKSAKATGKPENTETTDGETDNSDDDDKPATATALPTIGLPADEPIDENADADKPVKAKAKDAVELSPEALAAAAQSAVATPDPAEPETVTTPAASDPAATQGVAATGQSAAKPVDPDAAAEAAGLGVDADATEPHVRLKPHADAKADADASAEDLSAFVVPDAVAAKPAAKAESAEIGADALAALQANAPHEKNHAASSMPAVVDSQSAAGPQKTVAEDNVDRIVTSVRGEIARGGGTVQIRLDPPSLGQIQLSITVDDSGVLSASMQTSNDEATRLLSHNLAQLKSSLETAGVTVDRIQVKQAAPAEQSSNSQTNGDADRRGDGGAATQDQSARQEQQRREMLQRMWAKLAGTGDPLDLVG